MNPPEMGNASMLVFLCLQKLCQFEGTDLSCDCGNCSKLETGNDSVGVSGTGATAAGGSGESAVETCTSGIVEWLECSLSLRP